MNWGSHVWVIYGHLRPSISKSKSLNRHGQTRVNQQVQRIEVADIDIDIVRGRGVLNINEDACRGIKTATFSWKKEV